MHPTKHSYIYFEQFDTLDEKSYNFSNNLSYVVIVLICSIQHIGVGIGLQ